MNNKDIFAKNLQRLMNENGKSRRDVCEALGFSYYTFTDWVKGKKFPRMDKVEMLANYFGVMKSDLIEEKQVMVGETIRLARMEKGYTHEQLANLVGVDEYLTEEWEKGIVSGIKRSTLQKLAEVLEISPTRLLGAINETPVALAEGLANIYLDKELQEMIVEYNALDDDQKRQVRNFIHFISAKND